MLALCQYLSTQPADYRAEMGTFALLAIFGLIVLAECLGRAAAKIVHAWRTSGR